MPIRIARTVRTCAGHPSQWDAWTDTGQYLYLRYRHGVGTVEAFPSPDWEAWGEDKPPLIEWDDDTANGDVTLVDFLASAGIELTPDADVAGDPNQ